MEKRLSFSTSDVARFCHVTADTIRKWAEAGRIEVFKTPGGHRRIEREALFRFLRENQIPIPPELVEDGLRALVVEPDPTDRATIHHCLTQTALALSVETAQNAYEAGLQVGRFQPQLIFLSLHLPGVNPLELCTRLPTDSGRADSKVVGLIASDDSAAEERLREAGVTASLYKPVTQEAVTSVLQRTGHL